MNRAAYSVNEFAQMNNICRATVYKEIASGTLQTFKVGRRRLISANAANKWVAAKESEGQI